MRNHFSVYIEQTLNKLWKDREIEKEKNDEGRRQRTREVKREVENMTFLRREKENKIPGCSNSFADVKQQTEWNGIGLGK